ncbi:glycoside hydrolase family 17 protein [Dothidotthia symphoricarpi CBS 119687]|uniref:glucan endo-1,3-beta-D-glucosidase n=1 Tax=Dothidotthia symphoricarpi CBS 119687 TaxID=1392245 RepID=A0A6A6A4M4_9PLEO|nr:glycoside hydrolase family 17 protein [Dothidotthia symphoricarpi CBS 119687]KAF2126074.1 glycoside hydrolase family 17 protein [Dothidotthia symphoricarpi CBS 119687]
MIKVHKFLLLSQWLAPVASRVYTGFNYGAFWSEGDAKYEADFAENFKLASSINTTIPFDSARLFTCKTDGTLNDPTEAFDAAVATNTSLLLGFWVSPATRGDSPDEMIKNEMIALGKGFEKHGQNLSDLIIGLSVGNEDVFRWNNVPTASGLAADMLSVTISKVKKDIAMSPFAQYMEGKPIGHIDTAQYAVVNDDVADFVGVTVYPYWNNESIADAKESFLSSLEDVERRAGDTPIWIAETGWPFEGPQRGEAAASTENYQQYWKEVGCSIFGKYNTFWFELSRDTQTDQPDWGLVDVSSKQPRITDLTCPGMLDVPDLPANMSAVTPSSAFTLQSTTHVIKTVITTVYPTDSLAHSAPPGDEKTTTTITQTVYVPSSPTITPAAISKLLADNIPWCVTVADVAWNGQYVPVAANPAGPDGKCTPAPTHSGLPYGAAKTMVFQSYSSDAGVIPVMPTWAPSLEAPTPPSDQEVTSSYTPELLSASFVLPASTFSTMISECCFTLVNLSIIILWYVCTEHATPIASCKLTGIVVYCDLSVSCPSFNASTPYKQGAVRLHLAEGSVCEDDKVIIFMDRKNNPLDRLRRRGRELD